MIREVTEPISSDTPHIKKVILCVTMVIFNEFIFTLLGTGVTSTT